MLRGFIQIAIAGLLTLPGLAEAAGALQLPATNQTACFDGNGNPRACAGTGEDGEKLAGVAWPAPRFIDKLDGTVKDKLTDLVWSKHANSPDINAAAPFICANAENDMTWLQALDFIACLNTNRYLGSKNWRLPNLNELESLVNAGVADTSAYLNASGFVQVQQSQYWTSTSDASSPVDPLAANSLSAISAWEMDIFKGDFPISIGKNDPNLTRAVWPVSGTSAIPAQNWRTGQTLCFDEVGDTRPCAGTGEDGENLAGAPWPAPRFATNVGATITFDRLTGLIWPTATLSPGPAACADTGLNLSWQQALDHVACLNSNSYLGRSDWRLPNRKELRSLADYSTGAPALPAGHSFSDKDGLTYWSSTTNAFATREAWVISMFDGSLSSAVKAGTLPAWPVSGPDLLAPALTITQGNMMTNVASQTISGTTEAGATVMVNVNNGAPAAASVTGTTWSFIINPLASGANAITVAAADISENQTTASISITLDNVPPALSINPYPTRTNKKNHIISGTVEAGAAVAITTTGGQTTPATINGASWSYPVTGLQAGANNLNVVATDAVGNGSNQAISITLIVPDGIITGGSVLGIMDALRSLRITVGLDTATFDDMLHGDVAPLGAPDDKIDLSDALLILKAVVGLQQL